MRILWYKGLTLFFRVLTLWYKLRIAWINIARFLWKPL